MARLVTIGDSLTQGFMSGAIQRTELSYPTMIARSLGLSVPTNFRIPSFPSYGLPLNIEQMLIYMEDTLGKKIDLGEWFFRFPFLLEKFIDITEDVYERGKGKYDRPSTFDGTFHNLAVWGFRVFDSYNVDSEYCEQQIEIEEGKIEDDFLGLPSAAMYRTAYKVLNPGDRRRRKSWTQISNLAEINDEEGIENLIIWLGANDCLGTVVSLELQDMPEDFSSNDPEKRREYNLTHPKVFTEDFRVLVDEVKRAISPDTRVFVANIPYVTIPPITKGIGEITIDGKYFDKYGRFFADENRFNSVFNSHLTGEEVKFIEETIDQFNETIADEVKWAGENWHLVDMANVLNSLAVKRNNLTGHPEDALKQYYAQSPDHPLLRLNPTPSILGLQTKDNTRTGGGLFSLDFIHPTTICYGIIAEAFLRKMAEVGVPSATPLNLDWNQIIIEDSLNQFPPALWDDVMGAAERNATFWDLIFRVLA